MQTKYGSKVKLCYMDTGNFMFGTETKDLYKDIVKDVEKEFDTSGYLKDDSRSLPIGKNKKITGIMTVKLGGKIMGELVALRAEMYAHKNIDKKLEDSATKVQSRV